MVSRPLEDLLSEDISHLGWSAELLTGLPETPGYRTAEAYFADYPVLGLSSATSRAFMYNLIRATGPGVFVEIGTYHAGMTEVVARALWANGEPAHLITIDPYGQERVPGILKSWPGELSEFVSYLPLNSMEFFIQLRKIRPKVDICFVDGDHSYEFAFFDLTSIALWMRPGGIVIMDDYNQPGVFWATKHFLALNPGWRELGGVFDSFDADAPFDSIRPSIPGTGFLVLAAPEAIEIGEKPSVFEYPGYSSFSIAGLDLDLLSGHGGGKIEMKAYLRSFHHDDRHGSPEQLECSCSTKIAAGCDHYKLVFEKPLRTGLEPTLSRRELEINLIWIPDGGQRTLRLASLPQPLPAR